MNTTKDWNRSPFNVLVGRWMKKQRKLHTPSNKISEMVQALHFTGSNPAAFIRSIEVGISPIPVYKVPHLHTLTKVSFSKLAEVITIARYLDNKAWVRSEKVTRHKVKLNLEVFIDRVGSIKGSVPHYCNVLDWVLETLENGSPEKIPKGYVPVDLLEKILSPSVANTAPLSVLDFNFSSPINAILDDMVSQISRFSTSALSRSEFDMWHMQNTEQIQYLATLTRDVSDIDAHATLSRQKSTHFLLNKWDPHWVICCNTEQSNNVEKVEALKRSCILLLTAQHSKSYKAESAVAQRINLLHVDDDLFRIDMRSMSILDESQAYSVEYLTSNNLIQDAEHIWIYKLAKDAHTSCWVGFALISHTVYTLPDTAVKTIVQKLML